MSYVRVLCASFGTAPNDMIGKPVTVRKLRNLARQRDVRSVSFARFWRDPHEFGGRYGENGPGATGAGRRRSSLIGRPVGVTRPEPF
jgi:hypothetical protein